VQPETPDLLARIEELERQSTATVQLRAQYPATDAQLAPWRALAAGFAALLAEIEAKLTAS
jgi:hypothetical protein